MVKVVRNAYEKEVTLKGHPIDREIVLFVLNSDTKDDELHRLIQAGYKAKIKHSQKAKFKVKHH